LLQPELAETVIGVPLVSVSEHGESMPNNGGRQAQEILDTSPRFSPRSRRRGKRICVNPRNLRLKSIGPLIRLRPLRRDKPRPSPLGGAREKQFAVRFCSGCSKNGAGSGRRTQNQSVFELSHGWHGRCIKGQKLNLLADQNYRFAAIA
jgi:hypothetical protein